MAKANKTGKKIFNVENLVLGIIFLSFLGGSIYFAIHMDSPPEGRNYLFLFIQAIIGMVGMILPSVVKRSMRLEIPAIHIILYALFVWGSLFFGAILNFYYIIHHWDTGLHVLSGVVLGIMGFGMVDLLNDQKIGDVSPILAAMFAFGFAMALGVLWEIYEFANDSILGTNTQRFADLTTGEPLIGQAALFDTMKDLIANTVGAVVTSVLGYFVLKHKKGWFEPLKIRKVEKNAI